MKMLGVDALRCILLVANLLGVSAMGISGYFFLWGDTGESMAKLKKPDTYDVPPIKGNKTTKTRWETVKRNFNRKERAAATKEPRDLLPNIPESGRLSGFEITTIAYYHDGPWVFLAEKEAEKGPTGRAGFPRGARTPIRRTSSSSKKMVMRRAERKGRSLTIGDVYQGVTISEIHVEEEFIVYLDSGNNPHKLTKPPSESIMGEREGGGLVLNPIPDDDETGIELEPGDRGAIKSPHTKQSPTRKPGVKRPGKRNAPKRNSSKRKGGANSRSMKSAADALKGKGPEAEAARRLLEEARRKQRQNEQ